MRNNFTLTSILKLYIHRKAIPVLFLLFINCTCWSQLFVQSSTQTNAAGTGNGIPMIGTPGTNVIFSSAGKVNAPFGSGNTPCTNGYSGFTTPTGVNTYSVNGPAVEITLSPATGFVLSATGISAKLRYSATGPPTATYAYSIDGGTTWINNGNISMPQVACQSGTIFSWNFPCSVIVGVSQTFKFRIYFFGATGPTGTTQIENLTINGNAIACVAPTASISGTTTICGGGNTNITFTGTPASTVTYNVNGGPNQTILLGCSGTALVNTGALASTTTYNLVSVGYGSCSQSLSGSVVVTVIPPVSSAVISGSASICSGGSTNLSVAITGGVSPYTLIYSDGSTNTTITNYISGTNIPVSPTVNTTYTLVSVTSVSGCSSMSGSAVVTISAAPTAAVLSGTATICNGSSSNLSVAITGGISPYTIMYFNGVSNVTVNNYISGSSIPVSPVINTTYSLVSVTSAAGCPGTGLSGTSTITVRPTPAATVSGTITVCQNAASPNITFSNPQALPVTVTYNINGGSPLTINIAASTSSTVAAPTTTAGSFAYNLVSVAYQAAPTCTATITGQTATVNVNGLYSSAILAGNATICNSNSSNLSVNITGGVSPYTIVYNDGGSNITVNNYINGSAIPVSPVANTTYTLISVTGAGGCGGTGIGGSAAITVTATGTWLGINNNWNDPQNWCDGNIPTSATNVIIPSGVSFFPIITTTDPKSNNMTIAAGANINITATGTFSFAGSIINNGSITNNGTIVLNGTAVTQSFPGPGTIAAMNNLTINNSLGANLNKSLNIGGTLMLSNGMFTVGANTLTINNPVTGTVNNLSANNTSSIIIAGSAAGVNLPSSVTQLKNLTVSNSSGTILQGNLNIATLLFISATAGTVDADINTLNGAGNLQMSGGNLLLAKNGVVLPELAGTYTLTGGTVTFNGVGIGTDAQTVRPVNYFNLGSAATGDRILSNTGIIGISNIFTPFTNTYTVTGSTINFNKTNAQNIPAFTFYNLTLSGGNFTKTLGGDINIKGVLTFALNTKLALVNNNVTLKSDITNTATVASMPTTNSITYGTGRFIVERYIPVGINHIKSWQLLGVPVGAGQTIKEAWQEGATGGSGDNPKPGYGTQLTSNLSNALALGFDFYTAPGSTIKQYNPSSNLWDGVTNTSLPIASNKGYMLFVRGDRSVTAYNQAAVPTILRTKGKLFSPGTDAPPSTTVTSGKLECIGNPYASAIDFLNMQGTSSGIDSKYYVWDPLLPGTNSYGAYQTISSSNAYKPVPGGTANYPSGVPYTKIQPGQGFFVYSTPGGSVNFSESNKISGNLLVYRTIPASQNLNSQFLRAQLYSATGSLADGNALAIDDLFSNDYDPDDAIKLENFGENFGIQAGDRTLAVEARQPFNEDDTVFYKLGHLRMQGYILKFAPENLNMGNLLPWLTDNFTGTQQLLSITDTTTINFSVTADAGSADPGRFYIIFKNPVIVPVLFVDIAASVISDKNILVDWKVENEMAIDHYELERSNDGQAFTTIFTINPSSNNGTSAQYNNLDRDPLNGINFYRVKAIGSDRRIQYSSIVKLFLQKDKPAITIYPNPVIGKTISAFFVNEPAGEYNVRLYNNIGQTIFTKKIQKTLNSNSAVIIELEKSLPQGIYQLEITGENGFKEVKRLIIKR
ncbi:MAG: T9SS type A sorting domain-containing protein [Ferruginibacter sp.]